MFSKQALKLFEVVIVIERTNELTFAVSQPRVKKCLERFPLPKKFFETFWGIKRWVWLAAVSIHVQRRNSGRLFALCHSPGNLKVAPRSRLAPVRHLKTRMQFRAKA